MGTLRAASGAPLPEELPMALSFWQNLITIGDRFQGMTEKYHTA